MNIIFDGYTIGLFWRRVLVHYEGSFYIISENTAVGETMIFLATPTGEVIDWLGAGGGDPDLTADEVLKDFSRYLDLTSR